MSLYQVVQVVEMMIKIMTEIMGIAVLLAEMVPQVWLGHQILQFTLSISFSEYFQCKQQRAHCLNSRQMATTLIPPRQLLAVRPQIAQIQVHITVMFFFSSIGVYDFWWVFTGVSCASGYSGIVSTTACSSSASTVTLTGCTSTKCFQRLLFEIPKKLGCYQP